LFGVLTFLGPFYSIHLALIRLKECELQKLEKKQGELVENLDVALAEDRDDNILGITARLVALQVREKDITEAEEWPVNLTYLSALSGLALMTGGRLIVELVTRIL
jgi:hypothetical protein